MESKINISALELYCRKAVKPVLEKHFSSPSLNGNHIIGFCEIEQVNYFTLYLLFEKWKEEATKLESPYFDFQHQEVKDGLQNFMNILSQHISVKKEDFAPLLLQAMFNTLFFALSPIPFLEQKFIASDKKYSESELASLLKYLKIHPKLTSYLRSNSTRLAGKQGREIVQLVKEEMEASLNNTIETTSLLPLFDSLLPVQLSDFYYQETNGIAAPVVVQETPASQVAKPIVMEVTAKAPKTTPIHLHTKNKILDIRSAMNINQRFMFIKELFKGNEQVFQQAMDTANASENYETAVNTLIDMYAQKYSWEIDSEQVNELFDLIGRKFYPASFKD